MRWRIGVVVGSLTLTSVASTPKPKKKGKLGNTGVPVCKSFKCLSGERQVPTEGFIPSSYGCLEIPQLDKCCMERDVCIQTCGMVSQTCFNRFVGCSKKVCGTDYTCRQNAKVLGQATGGRNDKELCATYLKGQQISCDCVSRFTWKSQLNHRLAGFYRKYQPDKLDTGGRVRDVDRIWQRWNGNESLMFLTLTMKYSDKAVDLKAKPGQTRPGFKKPRASSTSKSKPMRGARRPTPPSHSKSSPAARRRGLVEERVRTRPSSSGVEDGGFGSDMESDISARLRLLESSMQAAASGEDYGAAQALKAQVQELRERELLRLAFARERAVKVEDYLLAKALKAAHQELQAKLQMATFAAGHTRGAADREARAVEESEGGEEGGSSEADEAEEAFEAFGAGEEEGGVADATDDEHWGEL